MQPETAPQALPWMASHEEVFSCATGLDATFWETEIGYFRNRELQYYSDANLRVADGLLTIEGRRQSVPNAAHTPGSRALRTSRKTARYTSGAIVSREALCFVRVEVVARSPAGAGMWPAIWLLHESATQYGEIDIFEAVGKHPDMAFAAVHFGRSARSRKRIAAHRHIAGLAGQWHTHTLQWTPSGIAIAIDNQPLLSMNLDAAAGSKHDPLRQPMRLRINLALGGTWGGPIDDMALPARLDVASIKIWRWCPNAGNDPPTGN